MVNDQVVTEHMYLNVIKTHSIKKSSVLLNVISGKGILQTKLAVVLSNWLFSHEIGANSFQSSGF